MQHFTPIASTIGGLIIGASAVLLLAFNGKIAGVSGIAGGLLGPPSKGDGSWRMLFVVGLVLGGLTVAAVAPQSFEMTIERSPWALAVAGLLVGIGTRVGNGCTSGHGVCGISRRSPRSLVATLTFIATGALAVLMVKHLFGGTV
jgi:uncharacterized membrane protein YedE/YeeE